jgi:hypothetical protein
MAAAEKVQQVVEELTDIRGADIVLEMKLVNSLAQINPKIFFIEDAKLFSRPLEQAIAVIMEGRRTDLTTKQMGCPFLHLPRSGHGIRKGKDFIRLRVALLY